MTDNIRSQYIESAVQKRLLPVNAHRMQAIISLTASNDVTKPIQFWQLYSVMGAERIINIVGRFYDKVFADEEWFRGVFARISGQEQHTNTQSAMWIDVMGGGHQYHGGEFRLNFHHTHNAHELMNDRGAMRWVELMAQTLNEAGVDYTSDQRVRPAINTFLTYFMGKYASEFKFDDHSAFGETNSAFKRRINFLSMTSEAIEALTEKELNDELAARGIDVSQYPDKLALVNKALSL